MRRFLLLAVILLAGCSQGDIETPRENTSLTPILTNLDTPWGMDFLPDGRMIFTERPGNVYIHANGTTERIAEIDVDEVSEAGLLGIAVDPAFTDTRQVYVYYTYEEANRVSRFTFTKDELLNETVLIDDIPNARFHDGGRIAFGPENRLYVTTGDATEPSSAQNTSSLAGKILRVNKNGSIPTKNPFDNPVYSYGHRNPQGIAWDDGGLYASEHGPNMNDEINLIQKGADYKWPDKCSDSAGENNLRCYTTFTLAPSGIAFHDGDLYIAGLRGHQLRRIEFAQDGRTIVNETPLFTGLGRIRNVVAHGEYLYIVTNNRDGRGNPGQDDDMILRYRPG